MEQYSILSENIYNTILALSDTEVGKIIRTKLVWTDVATGKEVLGFSKADLSEQTDFLVLANQINDLMVKFIREDEYLGKKMIVMERLYSVPYTHFTIQEKEKLIDVFESKLKELHDRGFVHGDLVQPRVREPECYDNIMLTQNGFRLVDTEFSMLRKMDIKKFIHKLIREEREFQEFKTYFLKE